MVRRHNHYKNDLVNKVLESAPGEVLGYATACDAYSGRDTSSQIAPAPEFRESPKPRYRLKKRKANTQGWVRYWFSYDDVNGGLIHRRGRKRGKPAARLQREYKVISADGCQMPEHRAVYLYHHGHLPEQVDHINRVPCDNRIANLRAASASQNVANARRPSHNTTGFKGVIREGNKVRAQVQWRESGEARSWRGKLREKSEDAAADYLAKAREKWGEFACAGNDDVF
jgi:hypothetical protein